MQGSSRKIVIGVVLTTLMVAIAGALYALASPPRYVATSTLLVGPVTSDVDTLRAAQSLTNTYSQLMVSPTAVQDAGRRAGLSSAAVTDAANVTFNSDTRIVVLNVTTDTSAQSRVIASTLTTELTRTVGTVDPTAPGALRVLTAQPQTAEEVTRSPVRYAILGGVGWLLLAIAVLAAFAAGTPRTRSREVDEERSAQSSAASDPSRSSRRRSRQDGERARGSEAFGGALDDGPAPTR